MPPRRPKFKRVVNHPIRRQITERSLKIISTIERYGNLPMSLLLPLVGGNPAVTYRHTRDLYDLTLINRYVLPSVGPPGEFIFYVDSPRALELVAERTGQPVTPAAREAVWRNREKAYCDLLDPVKAATRRGALFYVEHELTIARFRAMLELACRKSEGRVELSEWRQGAQLWDRVEVPKLTGGAARTLWAGEGETETLPYRPDAYFSLRFPGNPDGAKYSHFFYEADRATTSSETFRNKLRAYWQFIVEERRHREVYNIRRVRAVLVETLSRPRVKLLYAAAQHPAVSGEKPTPLFWFTTAELFTNKESVSKNGRTRELPRYLVRPEQVLSPIWFCRAGENLLSLSD